MSPCQGCHAGCCRSFAIPVTGADILQIEQQLGLDFDQFACRWADPHGEIACGVAPHFYFADEPATPFTIALQHSASRLFTKTTKCHFLVEGSPTAESPLGVSHCSIYHQRPLACRVFPTKLDRLGEVAELHSIPPYGRPSDPHPIYNLCPRPWEPTDVDPIATVQNLILIRFEYQFFEKVARIWNAALPEYELFPTFLREVYRHRVVTTADTPDQDLPATLPGPFSSWTKRAA
jgi:Fe-S-cluster containining protein